MAHLAVCHVEKCSGGCSSKIEQEEERHNDYTPNADRKRKHLNFSVHLDSEQRIIFDKLRWSNLSKQERIDARLATQKAIQITDKNGRTYTKTAKIRKDAVTHFNLILSGTHEPLDKLFQESRAMMENGVPTEKTPIGKWAMDNYLWLAKKAGGAENIVTFCVHLDETTPHIQATICPMYDGRLNSKKFVDGPKGLGRLQTEYAEKVSEKWGLERGVRGSKAKHQTLAEFYRRLEEASRTPGNAETMEVDEKQFKTQAPQIATRPPKWVGSVDKWMAEENERLAEQHRKQQQEMLEKTKKMLQQQVDSDNQHFHEVQNTAMKMVKQNYRHLSKNNQLKGQIDSFAETKAKKMTEDIKNKAHEEIESAKNNAEDTIEAARRDIREEIEIRSDQMVYDLVGPALSQVWKFIDYINGESTNLEDFETWEQYFDGLRIKLRQANEAVRATKERGGQEYQKKIFPILHRIWGGLDDMVGTKEKLPRKADDILAGIQERLGILKNEVLPALIEQQLNEEMKALVEPKNQTINQLEKDLDESKKENASLNQKMAQMRQMLSVFAEDNAVIQAGRKAIYSVSTTGAQKGFSPEQAEDVRAAICLGDDQATRQSIAEWLLDDVSDEIQHMSSTFTSWFEKFAKPETLSILTSALLELDHSQGAGIGGGGAKDLSKKRKNRHR